MVSPGSGLDSRPTDCGKDDGEACEKDGGKGRGEPAGRIVAKTADR